MRNLLGFIKRHPVISFFVLTYVFSWGLWLLFQPLYLRDQAVAAPFIMLGIFGPALVSIVLSAIIQPGKRQGNRTSAGIAFFLVWIPAVLLFVADQAINEGRSISLLLVVVSAFAAILPAFVLSLSFYSGPGIRDHLATLVRPNKSTRLDPMGRFTVTAHSAAMVSETAMDIWRTSWRSGCVYLISPQVRLFVHPQLTGN